MRADPVRPPARSITVEQAQALILRSVPGPVVESVPLADAAGRVLADPVAAPEDLWPFPRAAMDGVAVRAGDVAGATREAPVTLRVVGAAYSGQVWSLPLEPGTALRIATGTPVPSGADAVIPNEALRWDGDRVLISGPIPHGRHVFPAGEDARAGEVVLQPGTVLTGGRLGLLAALGCGEVRVFRRPVVAILATGDELVPPSAPPAPGQVRESNSTGLAAEVADAGATPVLLGIARDSAADLDEKLRAGLQADALIVCGGASVGEKDLVRDALVRAGATLTFVGVVMKPGSPVSFGVAGGRPAFALPGTPGAARIAFELLVRPAVRVMAGHRDLYRPTAHARLLEPVKVAPGRRRYLWGRATLGPSGVRVAPLSAQGTATLRSSSDANALIEVLPGDADLAAGAAVTVHLLGPGGLPTSEARRAAVGVVGAREAGKTTLIERLIPALARLGITAAVVKHHVHLEDDPAHTDTGRAGRAGAVETVLAGPGGIVRRHHGGGDASLDEVLAWVGPADLVLVEGYSRSALPKILVRRAGVHSDRPDPAGPIVAVVADPGEAGAPGLEGVPRFAWDATDDLAALIAATVLPRPWPPPRPGSR